MAPIRSMSMSTATERDIVESGRGRGSTGIGNKSLIGTEIEGGSGNRDREQYSSQQDDRCRDYSGSGGGAGLCIERNPARRMIGTASSGTMMIIVVTIEEGVKRACLLAGVALVVAVEHGKMLVVLHQRGGC